jgi:hypothetical protein
VTELWPWAALAALGVYHGLNPGMGWLLAVARGLQDQRRSSLLRSLVPIAVGHEASIAIVIVMVKILQLFLVPRVLPLLAAAALIAYGGLTILRRRRHPRGAGMRMSGWSLAAWSFLMSSAHGAGLMLVPVLLQLPAHGAGPHVEFIPSSLLQGAVAASIHTSAMLLVMAAVALAVYERFGVGLLRRAWFNLDLAWAVALVAAGVVTLVT